MRPYLVLMSVVLMAVAAFGQQPFPHSTYGPCLYGCGPFIPLVTTPEVSLEQYSLSQIQEPTDSVYTVPVWYHGGDAPLMTPQVHLWPEMVGREGHPMHDAMREERSHEEHGRREEARAGWTYFTGWEHTADAAQAASDAKGFKKAGHVYTNDDVTRQNEKNGAVKYDGKTEKM